MNKSTKDITNIAEIQLSLKNKIVFEDYFIKIISFSKMKRSYN